MKHRLELAFGNFARRVLRAPRLVTCALVLFAAWMAWHATEMRVENSSQSYLRADSPSRVLYDAFREEYGREDIVIVVIEGEDLFDLAFLEKIRGLHAEIETRVPFVKEVTSLVNARYTVGDGDELIVGELLEDWPRTPAEAEKARGRALANPLYRGTLLSDDLKATSLLVAPSTFRLQKVGDLMGFEDGAHAPVDDPLTAEDMKELASSLSQITARYEAPGFRIHIAGDIPLNAEFTDTLASDMRVINISSAIAVAIVLFLLFRSLIHVLLPLVVVGSAVAATQGAMVLLGIPLSSPLEVVPPLLLTVGICGSVHVLTMYDFELNLGRSKEEAIVGAIEKAGLAIAMASLTTALGLLSFALADVVPVFHVGVIAPLGVALTFLYNLALLPALMAILPVRDVASQDDRARPLGGWLDAASTASRGRAVVVVSFALASAVLAMVGVTRLHFSQNHLEWFPEDDAIRVSTELVDADFAGAMTAEVIVDTGVDGGVYEPAFLRLLSQAADHSEVIGRGSIAVGKAVSIVDILEETHLALNGNDPAFRAIPKQRSAVAQEILLFENTGSEDLADFTDSSFREARISMRVTHSDAIAYIPFLDRLESDLAAMFDGRAEIRLTGLMTLLTEGLSAIVTSTARSYVFAFAAVIPTMLIMIGNRQRGLLSVVPNLFPVLCVLGLMGWAGIGIDASTLMVGAIILGLAVDDTIHFFHNYERAFRESGDVRWSIQRTLDTAGVAIVTTSLVLTVGFLSFGLAHMQNVSTLGFLLAFATLVALLADVVLVPALLVLVGRDEIRSRVSQTAEPRPFLWEKIPLSATEGTIPRDGASDRARHAGVWVGSSSDPLPQAGKPPPTSVTESPASHST